jgi:holo-[acyl-carrier protein] synthase
MIVGHGIDVVEVSRFEAILTRYGQDAHDSYFTPAELARIEQGPNSAQRLAGRFAAKEAVLKALGTGLVDGIALTDVEILSDADGAPRVVLHAECYQRALEKRITKWMLSISHTPSFAVASAISIAD